MNNNRGFAISTMMYMILILGLTIVAIVLAMLNTRGNILTKLRNDTANEINDVEESDYICSGINTSGLFQVGDKYSCNLSNTEDEQFYIISSDSTSVDFISAEKLVFGKGNYGVNLDVVTDSKIAFITDDDYNIELEYKPITALKILKMLTDNWFYLDNRSDSKDGISYNDYKARLLSYSDITNDNIEYISNTLTSTIYDNNIIYSVEDNEIKNDKLANDSFNIVPVITVNKEKLKN